MDEHPHLRLVHDKSAPPGDTPARPKVRRRRRRKGSAEPCDHARVTAELAASRRELDALRRESLRENHFCCVLVFVCGCAYFALEVGPRIAAMP